MAYATVVPGLVIKVNGYSFTIAQIQWYFSNNFIDRPIYQDLFGPWVSKKQIADYNYKKVTVDWWDQKTVGHKNG